MSLSCYRISSTVAMIRYEYDVVKVIIEFRD